MAFISTPDLDKLIAYFEGLQPNAPSLEDEALSTLKSVKEGIAPPGLREEANDQYGNDDVEIDDEPGTSEADGGTWVAAWVWVAQPDDEEEDDE